MTRLIPCTLSMLLLLPLSAQAAPAITCHCFTDRSYNPSRPALADQYFLATTQNSFFAALFNVDKKTVVMKKQTGDSAEDLWIAYWVAARSGTSGEAILAQRENYESWKAVIVSLGIPTKSLGKGFTDEIAAGASSDRLAQLIVDDVLTQHRLLGKQELTALRKESASNQEVIIAALIATRTKRPAIQVYGDVKKATKSWGAFLWEAKMPASGIQAEFVRLLK